MKEDLFLSRLEISEKPDSTADLIRQWMKIDMGMESSRDAFKAGRVPAERNKEILGELDIRSANAEKVLAKLKGQKDLTQVLDKMSEDFKLRFEKVQKFRSDGSVLSKETEAFDKLKKQLALSSN